MEGTDLVDRYKRYKGGTTKIFDYIVAAAQELPEFTRVLPSVHAAKKAVKQAAKKTAKSGHPDSVSTGNTSVMVTTSQLIKLAELLAKHAISVPRSIFALLTDIINGRRECAEWYAKIDEPVGSPIHERNESHQHFIHILERVKEILRPYVEVDVHSEKHESHPAEDDTALGNVFTILQLEEPSVSPLGTEPVLSQPRISFKFEPSQEEDKTFAVWCFLQDMSEMRQSLKKVWLDYAAGLTTFAAASLTTETGIAIIRLVEEHFLESYPEFQDFWKVLEWMCISVRWVGRTCLLYPERLDRLPSLASESSQVSDHIIGELFCPHAIILLTGFRDSLGKTIAATAKDRGIMGYMAVHSLGDTLLSVRLDIETIRSGGVQCMIADQLLHGLFSLDGNRPIPSWLVSACQVYIDIYDIVIREPLPGFSELQTRMSQAKEDYRLFQGMPDRKGFDLSVRTVANWFGDTDDLVNRCLQDPVQLAYVAINKNKPLNDAVSRRKHRLETLLPLYGGHIAFNIQRQTHRNGIMLCNNNHMVLSAAYVYRACVQGGLLKESSWPDMDFVIANHSRDKPLVLEKEHDITSMARFFGLKLKIVKPGQGTGQEPVRPLKRWFEEHLSPTFPLFTTQKESNTRSAAGYREKVGAAIRCAIIAQQETASNGETRIARASKTSTERTIASFPPTLLLEAFRRAFEAWEPELNFKYTEFYLSCRDMLQCVRDSCDIHFKRNPPSAAPGWQHGIADLVYAILSDAARSKTDHNHKSDSHALQIASLCLASHTESYGSKFHQGAVDQSTGHIPVDQSEENSAIQIQKQSSESLSKLLIQWNCPVAPNVCVVFCRSKAEIDKRFEIGKAMIAMSEISHVGGATTFEFDTARLLKLVESSAAACVHKMSEEEETDNLMLFVLLFLVHAETIRMYADEIRRFMEAVYSTRARQFLKAGMRLMPPEMQHAIEMVLG